jgi:hypothetical protein
MATSCSHFAQRERKRALEQYGRPMNFLYHGIPIKGVEELKNYFHEDENQDLFSPMFNLPKSVHLMVAGMSFGFLGAVIGCFLRKQGQKVQIQG